MLSYKSFISLAVLLFVACMASAQQQQQITAPAACNYTVTKPTPTTKAYVFQTCIVAKFAAYLSLGHDQYIELNEGVVSNLSRCDSAVNNTIVDPMLVVDFPCGQLQFEMAKTNNSKIYVKSINGFYKVAATSPTFSNSTPQFETSESGRYYKCNSEQTVILDKPEHQLFLSNFAYEAFRTATGTDFYKIPEECALDAGQVSDLVRIGVGICLVALVVIVLIAYFVGRRRWSERSSYESV